MNSESKQSQLLASTNENGASNRVARAVCALRLGQRLLDAAEEDCMVVAGPGAATATLRDEPSIEKPVPEGEIFRAKGLPQLAHSR